jgi:hypothetical protein
MATLDKRKKRKLYYCGHCQKDVSKATYYRHRTEFYDDVLKDWRRAKAVRLMSSDEVESFDECDTDKVESESQCKPK